MPRRKRVKIRRGRIYCYGTSLFGFICERCLQPQPVWSRLWGAIGPDGYGADLPSHVCTDCAPGVAWEYGLDLEYPDVA